MYSILLAIRSNCESQVAVVSFPEAGKEKDDEEKLQEDF